MIILLRQWCKVDKSYNQNNTLYLLVFISTKSYLILQYIRAIDALLFYESVYLCNDDSMWYLSWV